MKKIFFTIFGVSIFSLGFAQTWTQVAVPTTNHLNDIEFASATVGYISGDNETLLKTTDGGENWSAITPIGINIGFTYNIGDLDFVSELIGFCNIPNSGRTYKTIDGGINWTLVEDPELGNFCYRSSIFAMDENNYFLGGAGCFQSAMIKENNNGVWTEKPDNFETFNSNEDVLQMDFLGQLGLAATNSKYMLRSIDAGQNWDTIPIEASGVLTSVVIIDAMLSYAGYDDNGAGFGILKSVDGGLTWVQDMSSATFYYPSYLSVASSANGDFYSGAYSMGVTASLMFETTDGTNWTWEEVDEKIVAIDSYGNDNVFGVGENGYVITNTDFGSLGLANSDEEVNVTAYPNPTTDNVVVSLDKVLENNPVVLNNLGQKIEVPIEKNNLSYSLSFVNVPNGIYTIKLKQNGFEKSVRIIKQ
jgi:photosystem II stability/assembly factor-like uncharacterized protein